MWKTHVYKETFLKIMILLELRWTHGWYLCVLTNPVLLTWGCWSTSSIFVCCFALAWSWIWRFPFSWLFELFYKLKRNKVFAQWSLSEHWAIIECFAQWEKLLFCFSQNKNKRVDECLLLWVVDIHLLLFCFYFEFVSNFSLNVLFFHCTWFLCWFIFYVQFVKIESVT